MEFAADHWPWLLLAWAAPTAALAMWILLQKRPPVSTLAWIQSLAALPVLGFFIYHWLGPTRIRRQRMKRQRSRQRLDSEPQAAADLLLALPNRLAERQCRLIERMAGSSPTSAAGLTLLPGGAETFDALIEAVAGAREHIHLEYYIVEPDRIGERLREALVERARAGVAVRFLIDAIGGADLSRGWLKPLREAGVEIAFFHPFRLATLKPLLNLRTHRKIAVIDGRIGFTGGINIDECHDASLRDDAWRDLHLKLEGPAVNGLQQVFVEDWLYASRKPFMAHGLFPQLAPGDVAVQWLASGPDTPAEPIHRAMLQALADAEQRVWLVTPYFVPTEPALYALTNAALRGLEVRLLVPRRADSVIVTYASRSYFGELIRAGVRVFEYPERMLHTKALLVDRSLCTLGSANFDARSFRLNFELAVNLYGEAAADALEKVLEQDFEKAEEVHSPRRIRFGARLAEASARLLSPVL